MEHQLRIPESYPMREQMEKAITDLLVFVEAGTIYISFDKQQHIRARRLANLCKKNRPSKEVLLSRKN
jgi:hypothetical protein